MSLAAVARDDVIWNDTNSDTGLNTHLWPEYGDCVKCFLSGDIDFVDLITDIGTQLDIQ